MAGFRKAKAEQAAIKMGIYGAPGSGKTFTSLLLAEGLAKVNGTRVAYIDTERGTDFYCKAVPSRPVHPEEFDFDAIYTRSLTEALYELKKLKPDEHGVIVLDSVTHMWEAAIAAYGGRQTSIGTIPMQAWGRIKKPYKELMAFLLSCPQHIIICGREGTEYATDEETEELKAVGKKMKAEGETPYEPHILIRMEQLKAKKTMEQSQIIAYIEKDRTGVLQGRSFVNPNFDSLCRPILPLLSGTQAQMETPDATAGRDAEALAQEESERTAKSARLLTEWKATIDLAPDASALKKLGGQISPQLKAQMTVQDVQSLREHYLKREQELPKT